MHAHPLHQQPTRRSLAADVAARPSRTGGGARRHHRNRSGCGSEIERRGFAAWSIGSDLETIQTGLRSRPRSAAETDEERLVADGLAMFADPAIAWARDLLDRTADWQPDMVVQEIYELGGTYVPPVCMCCMGWECITRTSI